MLVAGTHSGLFVISSDGVEAVTTDGEPIEARVRDLASLGDSVLAATDAGLFWSADDEFVEVEFLSNPISVAASDDTWYVGAYPLALYRVDPVNHEVEPLSLSQIPEAERWNDRGTRDAGSAVRTVAPFENGRLAAGIEVGGVVVSDDGGQTWEVRNEGLHDDVHHLHTVGRDDWLAATGNGLYRTQNAGRSWSRLDTDFRDFWFNYFREIGTIGNERFTAANGWGPETGGSRIFRITPANGTLEPVDAPTDGRFPISWASFDNSLYAGTMVVTDWFEQEASAPLLVRTPDGKWEVAAKLPAGITSLATLTN